MWLGPDLKIPPTRAAELRALLLRRPEESLYQLCVLRERGIAAKAGDAPFHFAGWPERGPLTASVFVGGWFACVFAPRPEDAAEIGRRLRESARVRRVIGGRAGADAFWAAWSSGQADEILRHDQQLMVARAGEIADVALPGLRPASAADEADVCEASAAMQREELGIDPRADEGPVFGAQVKERIASGRTWLLTESRRIVFKAEVALKGRDGAQIGGVWVPPSHRGRGLASRGTADLARRLLRESPSVSLHVNERSLPAVRAYRRAGFRDLAPYLLVRGRPRAGGDGSAV